MASDLRYGFKSEENIFDDAEIDKNVLDDKTRERILVESCHINKSVCLFKEELYRKAL